MTIPTTSAEPILSHPTILINLLGPIAQILPPYPPTRASLTPSGDALLAPEEEAMEAKKLSPETPLPLLNPPKLRTKPTPSTFYQPVPQTSKNFMQTPSFSTESDHRTIPPDIPPIAGAVLWKREKRKKKSSTESGPSTSAS
ncbi:hypothetical protein BST61_g1701 [Cercospora zeina]